MAIAQQSKISSRQDAVSTEASFRAAYPELTAEFAVRGVSILSVAEEMELETAKHYSPGELHEDETTRFSSAYGERLAHYGRELY